MNGQYNVGDVVLGKWTLVRLIGEGSYGKVYEAHRTDLGGTYTAAVKIVVIPQSKDEITNALTEGMTMESVSEYFKGFAEEIAQEFALMSELKGNSYIVSYEDHEMIPHTDGIGWDIIIRMELLTPLLTILKTQELSREEIIQLGVNMCEALELCKKNKIIHRDIKPENIFRSRSGDFKLGDFGVARTIDKTTGGMSKKGTYNYMAPEVYKEEPYDTTVDIYSLGIVLYRLLNNNRTPFLPDFPAQIRHADREAALVKRMSGAEIPPPANEQGQLSQIVLKACAYNPKDRYSDPFDMRKDLEALLGKTALQNSYEENRTTPELDNSALIAGTAAEPTHTSTQTDETVIGSLFDDTGSNSSNRSNTPKETRNTSAPPKKVPGVIRWILISAVAILMISVGFIIKNQFTSGAREKLSDQQESVATPPAVASITPSSVSSTSTPVSDTSIPVTVTSVPSSAAPTPAPTTPSPVPATFTPAPAVSSNTATSPTPVPESIPSINADNAPGTDTMPEIFVGDLLTFGKYEQDSYLRNGEEVIEWLVLSVQNDKALLISKYALENMAFEETNDTSTWEICSLRTWLNQDFYQSAFTDTEKNSIMDTEVEAYTNPKYEGSSGNNTIDKLFLLSISEAEQYFINPDSRRCLATNNVIHKSGGGHATDLDGNCWWWLRTMGINTANAAGVSMDGQVYYGGNSIHNTEICVRPAMWIDLSTLPRNSYNIISDSAISGLLNDSPELAEFYNNSVNEDEEMLTFGVISTY